MLILTLLEERLAVCRLDAAAEVPDWATAGVKCEKGWHVFDLGGPFEFSEVGILSAVTAPLAEAGVGIFAVSTFDTDYVLVKGERVDVAADALRGWGHEVRNLAAKEG